MEPDDELYRKICQGDVSAFDVLYERHKRGLFRYIFDYLKNREQSEEVFHETFMQVLKSSELQFDQGSFQGWLYLVARNLCLNRIRTSKRADSAVQKIEGEQVSPSAETLLLDGNGSERIRQAKTKLPENLFQVFQLRLLGLSYKDIATALQIPVGTVKSRFHTIVEFFRAEIVGD